MRALFSAFILTVVAVASSSLKARPKPQPIAKQSPVPETVSDVDFCDIVRPPRQFFGRTVRIKALWQQGHEFSYLNGVDCATKFRHEIAARWLNSQDPNISKMLSREYGGRAIITAVGTLRNRGKYYGYFRYLFEIRRLEDVQHVIEPYEGTVEAGHTYRATVRGDKDFGLRLVPPVRIEFHYSYHIKWGEFVRVSGAWKTSRNFRRANHCVQCPFQRAKTDDRAALEPLARIEDCSG